MKTFVTKNKSLNPLFEMVIQVLETKKIQMSTYKMRAQIFLDYLKPKTQMDTILELQCASNVVSLANFLFKKLPSFEEVSTCPAGCKPRYKYLPSVTICNKEIEKSLGSAIKDRLSLPGVRCRQKECEEIEDNSIYKIGKYNHIIINFKCFIL